jgi:hypothetical protein
MKVRWNISTGYVNRMPGWVVEIPDEDLEDCTESERDCIIDDYVNNEFNNKIQTYWDIIE